MRTTRAIEIGLCIGLLVGVTLGFVGGVGLVVKNPKDLGCCMWGPVRFRARTMRDLTWRKAKIQALDPNPIKLNRIWISLLEHNLSRNRGLPAGKNCCVLP